MNINSKFDIAYRLAKLAVLENIFCYRDDGSVETNESVEFSPYNGFAVERYNRSYQKYLDTYLKQVNCLVPDYETLLAIKSLVNSLEPRLGKDKAVFNVITKKDVMEALDNIMDDYKDVYKLSHPNREEIVNSVLYFLENNRYDGISIDQVYCGINSILYKYLERK